MSVFGLANFTSVTVNIYNAGEFDIKFPYDLNYINFKYLLHLFYYYFSIRTKHNIIYI